MKEKKKKKKQYEVLFYLYAHGCKVVARGMGVQEGPGPAQGVKISGGKVDREKIEDYLRFLTHDGETRFPIFACKSLQKSCHFVNIISLMLTLTLKKVLAS